ncbi:hypothetical protein [Kocuria palustris]|uniref:hypothetical protein n=1 Tax=Kocuria palustris TaxID=71999 RepID=UPI0021B2B693|nr:hypothetical protein [Kocuria palustris]
MGLLTQGVEVECGASGAPVRVLWEGRVHSVAEEPVRWHRRRAWWVDGHRAPRDTEVVDQEMWRVQVRLSPRSALITLELVHSMETGRWRLLRATTESGGGVIDLPLRRSDAPAHQPAPREGARIEGLRAFDSAS